MFIPNPELCLARRFIASSSETKSAGLRTMMGDDRARCNGKRDLQVLVVANGIVAESGQGM